MIGIIIAMEKELESYLPYMTESKTIAGKQFYILNIAGKEVVVGLSGIGKVNACYSSTILLTNFQVDVLISTGVSGGLGVTKIMDFVVATKTCQHDCDTTVFGDPIGLVCGLNKVFFDTDKLWTERFAVPLRAHLGAVACGDQVITSKEKCKFIIDNFNAIACDMESGAIAQVCSILEVPFVVLRCISDGADDDMAEDYSDFLNESATKMARGVIEVIESLED